MQLHHSSRQTILASTALTLTLVCDALLYLLLPIFYADLSLTFIWVGVLLSANRFIRILLNPLIVFIHERLGAKSVVCMAVIFASLACMMFLYPFSPWLLLIARMLWGFAYGLLRLACLYSATSEPRYKLKNMGWYGAIQEIGPLLVLLAAPWLNSWCSPQTIIAVALVLCLLAFLPVLMLRSAPIEQTAHKPKPWLPHFNDSLGLTFIFCLLFYAVWIIVLAPLLMNTGMTQDQAVTHASLFIVAKRSVNLILGLVAVKFTQFSQTQAVLHFANMLMIVAALVLAADSIYTASLLGNLGHALFMILMPKSLSDQYPDSVTRKTMLNDFTIYRDIAAAIGALLAGLLLTMHWVHEFYFGIGFLLLLFIPYKMLIKSRKVEK